MIKIKKNKHKNNVILKGKRIENEKKKDIKKICVLRGL